MGCARSVPRQHLVSRRGAMLRQVRLNGSGCSPRARPQGPATVGRVTLILLAAVEVGSRH